MRLVQFSHDGSMPRLGAITARGIADFQPIGVPDDMVTFAALADVLLPEAMEFLPEAETLPVEACVLHAPIDRPPKNVMCIDLNHPEAVTELESFGIAVRTVSSEMRRLVVATKPATSIIGPDEPIRADLDHTGTVDYQGELGIVIGEGGRDLAADTALHHVFGYTIINDVTSRQTQREHDQWLLAKGLDTFCPLGPAVVTADELPDVTGLWVRTRVNGERRQEFRIDSLVLGVGELVSRLSQVMTLEPGDVIACGTGPGTGLAGAPPRFLAAGDVVTVEIDEIGTLSNPVK